MLHGWVSPHSVWLEKVLQVVLAPPRCIFWVWMPLLLRVLKTLSTRAATGQSTSRNWPPFVKTCAHVLKHHPWVNTRNSPTVLKPSCELCGDTGAKTCRLRHLKLLKDKSF